MTEAIVQILNSRGLTNRRGYSANFDTEWPHAIFVNNCIAIHYKSIAWLLCEKISIVATFRSTCWVLRLQVKSEVLDKYSLVLKENWKNLEEKLTRGTHLTSFVHEKAHLVDKVLSLMWFVHENANLVDKVAS